MSIWSIGARNNAIVAVQEGIPMPRNYISISYISNSYLLYYSHLEDCPLGGRFFISEGLPALHRTPHR